MVLLPCRFVVALFRSGGGAFISTRAPRRGSSVGVVVMFISSDSLFPLGYCCYGYTSTRIWEFWCITLLCVVHQIKQQTNHNKTDDSFCQPSPEQAPGCSLRGVTTPDFEIGCSHAIDGWCIDWSRAIMRSTKQ